MKLRFALVQGILLFFAPFGSAAAPLVDGVLSPGEYKNVLVLAEGQLNVAWSIAGDSLTIAAAAKTPGWVSLGFGATAMMKDADMAHGWAVPGQPGQVLDCFSTGELGPHPRDLDLGGADSFTAQAATEKDGLTTIEFSRPLAASEAYDRPVAAGDAFIWAFGQDDGLDPLHLARGGALLAAGSAPAAPSGPSWSFLLFLLPHAGALLLSFLLMTAGMLVARYGKKNKKWLAIHKPLGVSAAGLGILGLGFAVYIVATTTGIHFRVPHAFLGAATLLSVVAAPLLGKGIFSARERKQEIRKAHRWTGRTAILLMLLTILSGLVQAGVIPLPGFPR